jgi:guanine nucleotide-binding protein subunit alpha
LKRDRALAKNEIKMLLLGAGESGKSTILKQMKLLHHGSYSLQEREQYREIIFSNTIQSMRAVLDAIPTLGLNVSAGNEGSARLVEKWGGQGEEMEGLDEGLARALDALWKDPAVQEAVRRSREFQLNDSAT